MRVGYLIDTNVLGGGSLEDIVEEGLLAERAGFHSVQVPDRHGRPECAWPGPEQLLTILARETSRVMLGSFTFVGTLVHPMKAAEQFSVIDNLSGGRLVTTMSRGFLPAFWNQFGVPQERLLGRFQETLRVWRAALAGEQVDVEGEFWGATRGRLAPPPFQDGGWPIWGGGNASPAAVRRSAEYGAAWTCDPMPMTREAWDETVGVYRERAAELGKRPFVVLMRDGWVADTSEEAATVVRRALRPDRALLPQDRQPGAPPGHGHRRGHHGGERRAAPGHGRRRDVRRAAGRAARGAGR